MESRKAAKISSLEAALTGNLAPFAKFLYEAGYEDLDFILSLGEEEWNGMMDAMDIEARNAGEVLKPGHKAQLKKR
jgi:hypothetical protein